MIESIIKRQGKNCAILRTLILKAFVQIYAAVAIDRRPSIKRALRMPVHLRSYRGRYGLPVCVAEGRWQRAI